MIIILRLGSVTKLLNHSIFLEDYADSTEDMYTKDSWMDRWMIDDR